MIQIIPAILPTDFEDLRTRLAQVRKLAPFVQVDICDGEFVPSVTWPYGDPGSFAKILSEDEGFPFWEDFQFEFDLMVARPEEVVQDWIDAGASRIIIHNKSTEKLGEILDQLERSFVESGVALQIDEDPKVLAPYIEKIDFIQCMGIARIGHQAEPFDEKVVHKIKEVRALFPDIIISVDGGVNFDTAEILGKAGANRLVSGSAIFNTSNPEKAIESLKEKAESK